MYSEKRRMVNLQDRLSPALKFRIVNNLLTIKNRFVQDVLDHERIKDFSLKYVKSVQCLYIKYISMHKKVTILPLGLLFSIYYNGDEKMYQKTLLNFNCIEPQPKQVEGELYFGYSCRPKHQDHSQFSRLTGWV